MTNEELANDLETSVGKATPGPWRTRRTAREAPDDAIIMDEVGASVCDCSPGNPDVTYSEAVASAALIVALRNNLPAIISALRENGKMREALAWYADEDRWRPQQVMRQDIDGHAVEYQEPPEAAFDGGDRARDALRHLDTSNLSNTP